MVLKVNFIIIIISNIIFAIYCQGDPVTSSYLEKRETTKTRLSLFSDFFSYFYDDEEEEDNSSKDEYDNLSDEQENSHSGSNKKYEICRDCNISYQNLNSVQHINHYYQPTTATQKPHGKPTSIVAGATTIASPPPPTVATMKATVAKQGATATATSTTTAHTLIKTTTPSSATVFPKAIITTTSATPKTMATIKSRTMDVEALVTTTSRLSSAMLTTKSTTSLNGDVTTIPPAPVPDPLEPSQSMPSDEALTSDENE